MIFSDLQLIEPILTALEEEGYTKPTPIQQQSIPIILEGTDLLGCAQTGTGKTAAFAIPIIQLLSATPRTEKKRKIRSLILTPTRELALQIQESFAAYGRHTSLRSIVIFGGVGQARQVDALEKGVDILIATPGRLMDLIGQKYISLSDIEIFVLDEADRMLDMGFVHDVRKIVKLLPEKRQNLFFSATMPDEIVKLAHSILVHPSKVTVTPVSSTADIIEQRIYYVDRLNKNHLLRHILKDENIKTVLVFTRTKHGADKVVRMLTEHGIVAEAIHGNKGQGARQRALSNFKAQTTRVLVATDIAARGIDVDELEYVINYEMPNIAETYVHRIGRTGRAGARGTAFSFVDAEEKEYLQDIESLISKKIPVISEHPYPLMNQTPAKSEKPVPRGTREKYPAQKDEKAYQKKDFARKETTEKLYPKSSKPFEKKDTPRYSDAKKPYTGTEKPQKPFAKKPEGTGYGYPPKKRDDERGIAPKKYNSWEKDTTKKTPTVRPWEEKKNPFYKGKEESKGDAKTLEKPKRVNKRAERSWSKNKALAAAQKERENNTPRQRDPDKPERTRSPRAKKTNPKPFIPQPPKRWSEKK